MGLSLFFLAVLLTLGSGQNDDRQMGWWKHAVIYQIYPKSFQSTTGSGTGDLKGILQRFDYIKSLGVDAIWINPIYPSITNADAGYDISNFKDVDPNFGTIQDLKDLIEKCHNNSIKIVLDFVPNHSSSGHEWFKWSVSNYSEYTDYYIWRDPGPTKLQSDAPSPPNNWLSNMNGPAWTYSEIRKQFYLHQFLKEQPDLNYNNPKIRQEMQDVLKFWLDLNVDGFRMDAVYTIWEDLSYRDEPPLPGQTITDYNSMDHIYTAEQPQTFDILAEFRQVLDSYTNNKKGFQRIMFTESYTNKTSMLKKYYGTNEKPISHFPFNFLLLKNMKIDHIGEDWAKMISSWFEAIPLNEYWPNWVMGNHDNNRMSSRLSPEHTDIIHMSLMSLPGTYIIYYGDELALQDSFVRRDEGVDPQGTDAPADQFLKKSRDPARGPMPWNDSDNGGFSTGKPWLPLTSYRDVNVQAQSEDEKSHLNLFKKLVEMRKLNTYKNGDFIHGIANATTPEVLIITRSLVDHPTIVTLANFGRHRVAIDLQKFRPSLPEKMIVFASSSNSPFYPRDVLNIKPIVLDPISGVVLSTATLD